MNLFFAKNSIEKSDQGFTLIEMIISVGILLIVVGGGIAGYISFNDRQEVLSTAKELQNFLRAAQTKARVGEVPADCATSLQSYRVVAQGGIDGTTVTLVARCGTDRESRANVATTTQTMTLPNNVAITTDLPGNDLDVEFFVLHGGVFNSSSIQVDGLMQTYEFAVTDGGEITQGDFLDGNQQVEQEQEEQGNTEQGGQKTR